MPQTFFILADSALELIPQNIQYHEIIKKNAKKRGKIPQTMILDSSYHHKAMTKIMDSNKRGRPDILHFSLLNLLGAPIVRENPTKIKILIHTYTGKIIEINPETRIPKHYPRFIGLMEQLLVKEQIQSKEKLLMKISSEKSIKDHIKEIPIEQRLLLTHRGEKIAVNTFFDSYSKKDLCLIIGCFPHGYFSKEIEQLTSNKISISEFHLEAWTVLARIAFLRELSLFE